jgi:hypothetical protein
MFFLKNCLVLGLTIASAISPASASVGLMKEVDGHRIGGAIRKPIVEVGGGAINSIGLRIVEVGGNAITSIGLQRWNIAPIDKA